MSRRTRYTCRCGLLRPWGTSTKISYDREVDALFVHRAETPTHESEEVAPGVIFDFDEDDRVVQIELLNASEMVIAGYRCIPSLRRRVAFALFPCASSLRSASWLIDW